MFIFKPSLIPILICLFCGHVLAEDTSGLEDVYSAWRIREAAFGRVKVQWQDQITWEKGGIQAANAMFGLQDIPSAQLPCTALTTLCLAGDRIRIERDEQSPDGEGATSSKPGRNHRVESFDGVEDRFYFTTRQPTGEIHGQPPEDPLAHFSAMAIRASLRPLAFFKKANAQKNAKLIRSASGSTLAIEINQIVQGRKDSQEIWVDPKRDFIPYRLIHTVDGLPLESCEIEYARDGQARWTPRRWTITLNQPDFRTRRCVCVGTVSDFQVNPSLEESEFRISFPEGTWVADAVHNQSFIQRANGERRLILPEEIERRIRYHDLLTTEPGALLEQSRTLTAVLRVVFMIGNIIVLILVSRWLMARRSAQQH
ncbi:MAG TPA: hypothetical protein VFE24_03085 [Pirellulales bacterium]|jgi:hypothetical protein|nr:hypothetical protein [Pirellulales bacterium]